MSIFMDKKKLMYVNKRGEIQRHEAIMSKKNPFRTNNPLFPKTNQLRKFSKMLASS